MSLPPRNRVKIIALNFLKDFLLKIYMAENKTTYSQLLGLEPQKSRDTITGTGELKQQNYPDTPPSKDVIQLKSTHGQLGSGYQSVVGIGQTKQEVTSDGRIATMEYQGGGSWGITKVEEPRTGAEKAMSKGVSPAKQEYLYRTTGIAPNDTDEKALEAYVETASRLKEDAGTHEQKETWVQRESVRKLSESLGTDIKDVEKVYYRGDIAVGIQTKSGEKKLTYTPEKDEKVVEKEPKSVEGSMRLYGKSGKRLRKAEETKLGLDIYAVPEDEFTGSFGTGFEFTPTKEEEPVVPSSPSFGIGGGALIAKASENVFGYLERLDAPLPKSNIQKPNINLFGLEYIATISQYDAGLLDKPNVQKAKEEKNFALKAFKGGIADPAGQFGAMVIDVPVQLVKDEPTFRKQYLADPLGTLSRGGQYILSGAGTMGEQVVEDAKLMGQGDPYALGATAFNVVMAYEGGKVIKRLSPLKYEKLTMRAEKFYEPDIQVLDNLKLELARKATKKGGAVGGSSALEVQIRDFRKSADLDIKAPKEVSKTLAFESFDFLKKRYGNLDKLDVDVQRVSKKEIRKLFKTESIAGYINEAEIKKGKIKLVEPKKEGHVWTLTEAPSGKTIIDIKPTDMKKLRTFEKEGIRFVDYKEILADKYKILHDKRIGKDKKQKALEDIQSIEDSVYKDVDLYKGLVLQFKEGKAYSLFGKGEKGFFLGEPKTKNMPSLEKVFYPEQTSRNIISYPETAMETKIMTRKDVLIKMGATEETITGKIEPTKIFLQKLRTDKNIFLKKQFPRQTKALDAKAITEVLNELRANKNEIYKIYGSFPEMSMRMEGLERVAGDIEISFKSREKAVEIAENIGKRLKKKGYKGVKVNTKDHITVEVAGKKAIEAKYLGETEPTLEGYSKGTKGLRYGFKEDRPLIILEYLRTATLEEQFVRKAGASAMWWRDKSGELIIEPATHRPKDVADAYAEAITMKEIRKRTGAEPKELAEYEQAIKTYRRANWRTKGVQEKLLEVDNMIKKNKLDVFKLDITDFAFKETKLKTKAFSPPYGGVGSRSFSPYITPSRSPVSKPVSHSRSLPAYLSKALSPSVSLSKSTSPSAYLSSVMSSSLSPSLSPSRSPSLSPSLSPSRSPSLSPSLSPSRSPYISRSPYGYSSPPNFFPKIKPFDSPTSKQKKPDILGLKLRFGKVKFLEQPKLTLAEKTTLEFQSGKPESIFVISTPKTRQIFREEGLGSGLARSGFLEFAKKRRKREKHSKKRKKRR